MAFGLPGKKGVARLGAVASILAGGRKFAQMNFRSGCEAADVLAARLKMSQPVRNALACTFERWNGRGQPNGVRREQIPPGQFRRQQARAHRLARRVRASQVAHHRQRRDHTRQAGRLPHNGKSRDHGMMGRLESPQAYHHEPSDNQGDPEQLPSP